MIFNFSIKNLALVSAMSLAMLAPAYSDDTPLAEEMETLSGSLKKLRKAETTEEKIALVHAAQTAALNSLKYVPMMFEDIKDEKEKAKATADYKMMSGQVYVKLCALELACLAGDEDRVDEIKGELKDLKKEGHKKYTE